jgi:hypothetical protein
MGAGRMPHTNDPSVSAEHLAAAIRSAAAMGITEKERVCDRIYAGQPNLLGSVLVLPRFGVSMPIVDVILNILIVLTLAIEESRQELALVTEADQERELQRLVAVMRFSEGLAPALMAQSIEQTTAYRHEKFLLAYVVDALQRAGLAAVIDDAAKFSTLAALNLVNCIATAKRRRRAGGRAA